MRQTSVWTKEKFYRMAFAAMLAFGLAVSALAIDGSKYALAGSYATVPDLTMTEGMIE